MALFIASKVRTNIRELEGSLIRLIAYASLTGRDIDLPLAHETLRDLLHTDDKPVSIEMIQKFVADHYNLKISDLKAKNNSKSIAGPRQIAMYLAKNLTGASLPEIGKEFGGKHHSTVIHSIRKIEDQRRHDPGFRQADQQLHPSIPMSLPGLPQLRAPQRPRGAAHRRVLHRCGSRPVHALRFSVHVPSAFVLRFLPAYPQFCDAFLFLS